MRLRHALFGKPRDLEDTRLFHRLALIPFLAWVGLGADGLSSSSYGPEEAFKALGAHTFLAIGLAALMAITVILISAAYSHIIEEFPSGGGGYVVATKLLGERAGVVSGSALLVDYVLTITTSIAAAGDAIFSYLPPAWHGVKLGVEVLIILFLITINIRGVRESVMLLLPVFLIFLVSHLVVIGGGILGHLPELPHTVTAVGQGWREGLATVGALGLLQIFVRAYSLGGGTYTGIEAVSNGLPIMREPRVKTGRRTMVYMASSLAFTAAGLLLCYLLWGTHPDPNRTMNAVLVDRLAQSWPGGHVFAVLTVLSEGLLLVVAAQAGFIDGPRVLANMAVDSWMPHRFAALSERLTTQNGIVLMGVAALIALLYTHGAVDQLIVMYSINVFLTFSLSMLAMLRFWIRHRRTRKEWKRRVPLFTAGFLLCATILLITLSEKFLEGGWITAVVTTIVILFCFAIRRHYFATRDAIEGLYKALGNLPDLHASEPPKPVNKKDATAVILVASYGGIGIHTMLNVFRSFPGHFKNLVFVSVGVVDSGEFKGEHAVEDLRHRTEEMLGRYVQLANSQGIPADSRYVLGTEVVEEAEALCLSVAKEFPRSTFFAGKLIFQKERWWHRLLHNETAEALQKRLQWVGKTMVTLPVRVHEA